MQKEGKEFDRGDLIRHIAEKTGLPIAEVQKVVEWVPITIADAINFFGRAEIKDFGTFTTATVAADKGFLPDGEPWAAPERLKIKFRAAPAIKEQVANASQKIVI